MENTVQNGRNPFWTVFFMLQKIGKLQSGPLKLCMMALALLLSLVLVTCSWAGFRQQQLASRIVRFHVVANSDGEEDQRRKLSVRDAVEPELEELLRGVTSPAQAQAILADHLQDIAETGAAALRAAGGSGTVTAELGRAYYPTKEMGDFALPAGEYASLRISIGAGEGHNWWCILFPDLDAGESDAQTAMAEGLSEDDVGLMTRSDTGYEIRFFLIEWWESLQSWLSR